MELLPNLFIQVSVRPTNVCSAFVELFVAATACQHSESTVINHHTFDQNAANLYRFLWWKDRKAVLDLVPLIGLVQLMAI